ncbi:MAG TPA: peptide chain release factor 1 [Actinobacteria bacterium]|nr:peptide chain release factor 1 [Actinomycetota bacterium]
MQKKIEQIVNKYKELEQQLTQPEVFNDPQKIAQVSKEHASLKQTTELIERIKKLDTDIEDARTMVSAEQDSEMRQFLEDEMKGNVELKEQLEEELKTLLVPKDPNDEKDIIMEIRAGAGGNEAALFAGDLYRLYSRFAERNGFKVDTMNSSPADVGGYKEIIFGIEGKGAYSLLKYESGVHRVQRIPVTESGGRIHTSTATVAVLPEVEDVEVELDLNDLSVDVFRSSGPGGQSVNTTDSAVRITHEPTGIVVSCQDQKSQLQNKVKAMKILRARLYEKQLEEQQKELAGARRVQIGTGDRSEKIRTYNFPQNRITDHRIKFSIHGLESVLDGEISELIQKLSDADREEKSKITEQAG